MALRIQNEVLIDSPPVQFDDVIPAYLTVQLETEPGQPRVLPKADRLNLAFVLDVSESAGLRTPGGVVPKIEVAFGLFTKTLHSLTDNDIISAVFFNHSATTSLQAKTKREIVDVDFPLKNHSPSGSTFIGSGLNAGMREVERSLSQDRINAIFLISDGESTVDRDREICTRLLRECKQMGILVFALGLDATRGSRLAKELVGLYGANHVKTLESDVDLIDALPPLQTHGDDPGVSNIVVRINNLAPTCHFREINSSGEPVLIQSTNHGWAGTGRNIGDEEEQSLETSAGSLIQGETLVLLCGFGIKAKPYPELRLADVTVEYDDGLTRHSVKREAIVGRSKPLPSEIQEIIDTEKPVREALTVVESGGGDRYEDVAHNAREVRAPERHANRRVILAATLALLAVLSITLVVLRPAPDGLPTLETVETDPKLSGAAALGEEKAPIAQQVSPRPPLTTEGAGATQTSTEPADSADRPEEDAALKVASLVIVANVESVVVSVDGRSQGVISPTQRKTIRLSPGQHTVQATKPGYSTWAGSVDLRASARRELFIVMEPVRPTPQERALEHLRRAEELFQQGQYDAAMAECDEGLALDPDNGELRAKRRNIERARQVSRRSTDTTRTNERESPRTETPPPISDQRPRTVSRIVQPAQARRRVEPIYPSIARSANVWGTVIVNVEVDERGNVTAARALQGPMLLRQAAVAAAKQWKFTPARLGDQPVRDSQSIRFEFKF